MNGEEIHQRLLEGTLTLSALSESELEAWANWEYPAADLTSFDLGNDAHRSAFLWEFYWQGETAIFAAVAHVWDSLEGQREAHGTRVGCLAGCGGKGRRGLALTLRRFLDECLQSIEPLPDWKVFSSMEEWNERCQHSMADDEARVRFLCSRYSQILDGQWPTTQHLGSATAAAPADTGTVVVGPWKSSH